MCVGQFSTISIIIFKAKEFLGIKSFFPNSKFLPRRQLPNLHQTLSNSYPEFSVTGIFIYCMSVSLYLHNCTRYFSYECIASNILLYYHIGEMHAVFRYFSLKGLAMSLIHVLTIVISGANWQLASCKKFWIWKKLYLCCKLVWVLFWEMFCMQKWKYYDSCAVWYYHMYQYLDITSGCCEATRFIPVKRKKI